MYEIEIKNSAGGNTILHSIDSSSYRKVLTGSFTEIAAPICRPTAQFSVPPQNPCYDYIREMTTLIEIRNTITDEVEFEGRVIRKLRDSLGSDGKIIREYAAEGLISWLMDSIQTYHKATESPTEFLTYVLGQHNARFPDKEILLGTCDVTGSLPCETSYKNTLEEINTNLIKRLGGEINVRRDSNGDLRLDYFQNGIGSTISSTTVQLGRNLRSLSSSSDPTKIVNRIIPLGKKQADGSRLTLQGYFEDPAKIWVDDSSSVYKYSAIEGTAVSDDIETQADLYAFGVAELAKGLTVKQGYSAEVLDLSTIGEELDTLRAGNTYHFYCSVNGVDADLRLVKRTVNIMRPYSPTVEIGTRPERLTYTAAQTKKTTEEVAEKLEDDEYVTKEEYDEHLDEMQEYVDALDVWREGETPLPDTMEDLKEWHQDVSDAIAALQTAVSTLQSTAVTSTDIRTIDVVAALPANPSATVLYVIDWSQQ